MLTQEKQTCSDGEQRTLVTIWLLALYFTYGIGVMLVVAVGCLLWGLYTVRLKELGAGATKRAYLDAMKWRLLDGTEAMDDEAVGELLLNWKRMSGRSALWSGVGMLAGNGCALVCIWLWVAVLFFAGQRLTTTAMIALGATWTVLTLYGLSAGFLLGGAFSLATGATPDTASRTGRRGALAWLLAARVTSQRLNAYRSPWLWRGSLALYLLNTALVVGIALRFPFRFGIVVLALLCVCNLVILLLTELLGVYVFRWPRQSLSSDAMLATRANERVPACAVTTLLCSELALVIMLAMTQYVGLFLLILPIAPTQIAQTVGEWLGGVIQLVLLVSLAGFYALLALVSSRRGRLWGANDAATPGVPATQENATSSASVALPEHGMLVKPLYSTGQLVKVIAAFAIIFAIAIASTQVLTPRFVVPVMFLGCIYLILFIVGAAITRRARKRADAIRQAAAASDDAATVMLLTPASAPSAGHPFADSETIVVEMAMRWRTLFVLGGILVGFAALCGYGAWSLSAGLRTLTFAGAGRANITLFLLCIGGFCAGIYGLLSLLNNEARWRFIADAQGFELRYRWTRRRIAWQEVRLFWVVSAPNTQKPALNAWDDQSRTPGGMWPQRIPPGVYELAGRRRIVRFAVPDPRFVRVSDIDEHERRVQALFGAIVMRSQTPLRMAK